MAKIIEQARAHVGRTVDVAMCITYFEVGRMIVEEEQGGKARADYGKRLIAELSERLTERFGRGFSVVNLKSFRMFYQVYASQVEQEVSAKLETDGKGQLITAQSDAARKGQLITAQFENTQKLPMISKYYPFRLGWTHYQILMRIKNADERRFYEIEAINQQWTVEQLQRQYDSSLYERLALSRNKNEVMRLAKKGQTIEKPRDILKKSACAGVLRYGRKSGVQRGQLGNRDHK